jgi:hypothetical protein
MSTLPKSNDPTFGRVCLHCLVWKDKTHFHKHAKCRGGLNTVCKECRKPLSKNNWINTKYVNKILSRAKSRAVLKGREFSIDESDIHIPDLCPILGVPLIEGTEYAPSIDRIDSTKGYVKGNVQIISKRANVLKNNATAEELEKVFNFMVKSR